MRQRPLNDNRSRPHDDSPAVDDRTDETTVISVECDTASLRPLRHRLDDQLTPVLADRERATFLLAVNEAVTNAIESHERNGVTDPITVTVDEHRQQVTVEDRGGGFDAGHIEEWSRAEAITGADLTEAAPPWLHRGRGLKIIRSTCPEARLQLTGAGLSVILPWN